MSAEQTTGAGREAELAARLFFVEHELIQSHHTISFLDGLSRDRQTYPYMTQDHLRDIEILVTIPQGCAHSRPYDDCERCQEHVREWRAAQEHAAVLGWPTERGRWPRPNLVPDRWSPR